MAPLQVKKKSDLPSWFDLSKYDGTKQLSAEEWYWQLALRIHFNLFVNNETESFWRVQPDSERKREYLHSKELLAVIRCTPIFDIAASDAKNAVSYLKPNGPSCGVSYTTTANIASRLAMLSPEEHKQILTADWGQDSREFSETPIHKWTPTPNTVPHSEVILSVDLDVPERLLMEHFAALVREAKKNRSDDSVRFRTPDFREWHRLGLLPYLDLYIWECEVGTNIPVRVYADAIFSGDEEGEETVRKSTSRIAQQVINGSTDILSVLGALAYSQSAQNT
jgi:hypothetical protein